MGQGETYWIPFVIGIVFLKPIIEVFWCVNTTYENTLVNLGAWNDSNTLFSGAFSDKDFRSTYRLVISGSFISFCSICSSFLLRFVRLKLVGSVRVNFDATFQFFVTKKLGLFLLPLVFFPLRYSLKQPGIGLNQVTSSELFCFTGVTIYWRVALCNRECLKARATAGTTRLSPCRCWSTWLSHLAGRKFQCGLGHQLARIRCFLERGHIPHRLVQGDGVLYEGFKLLRPLFCIHWPASLP